MFAQVYVHDEQEQLRIRLDGRRSLRVETINFWNNAMALNPFATRFRQIGLENASEVPEKHYVIKERIGDDIRR